MAGRTVILVILVFGGSVFAATPAEVKALRRVRRVEKNRVEVLYQFEDEFVTLEVQAGRRGCKAAGAWAKFDKASNPVAVIARSPFGGGESAKSYWPAGAKAELLQGVVEPLKKAGLKKVVLPDLIEEKTAVGRDEAKRSPGNSKAGLPGLASLGPAYDYEFVLVVGLHHEPVPHGGVRRTVEGKAVYSRSSRVNAWAVLFHAPTATAFWCATATAGVDHRTAADPLNAASATAIGALDFTGIGADNIPKYIKQLAEPKGHNCLDIAAMLAQTQRADAAEAIVRAATSVSAFKNTVRVVRYVSQRGVVQDYRTDRATAGKRKFVEVSQPVMIRVLLLEHLRGFRGIGPCVVLARVPRDRDFQIPRIGRRWAGRLMPLSADDEIVLIGELASGSTGLFSRNRVAAVRNLGRCRVRIDEAKVVAGLFANRKIRKPKPGRKPRRDYLKEAGAAALKELNKTAKQKIQ